MHEESEHPYTAMIKLHYAYIAAGLISPYGQMKRKVLTKAQKEHADANGHDALPGQLEDDQSAD
jgi:hypothetical protein